MTAQCTKAILLAHPTGNSNSRAAARAFLDAGWLQEFHTCVCWNPRSPLAQLLPAALADQLSRRSFANLPRHLQHAHPRRELLRLAGVTRPLPWLGRHERAPLSIDAVYRSLDRQVAARLPRLPCLKAVYAYEDGALSTFQAADRLGLSRIYDLPIGYWRSAQQIFQEERELQPEWACTITGLADSRTKLDRKDQELQLADLVVVPSEFVRSTLVDNAATAAPIAVVPFGSPQPLAVPPLSRSAGPLRVLFVGSLGQRKGLSYALDAVAALGSQVSLTLIGKVTAPHCRPLVAALERHHWIESVPHSQILEQMRQHDVLVLPSLFEGYALVISEALSQGLPVLTTPNSGAALTIRDGVEGFIVPIRDSQSIADRLQQLADNRDQLAAMRQACLRRASELSWAGYENGLVQAVGQVLQQPSQPG
jgi:glycosyltransferase involved in cell wall biosynthesis